MAVAGVAGVVVYRSSKEPIPRGHRFFVGQENRSCRTTDSLAHNDALSLTSSITSGITTSMDTKSDQEHKVRENRLRRAADRQGLRLVKSRSRDTNAMDFGLYALIDHQTGGAVNEAIAQRWVCSWDLDEVEAYLASPAE